MTIPGNAARAAVLQRLERCYAGAECAWNLFYQPRWERANFATRYHLVYPALVYFILLHYSVNRRSLPPSAHSLTRSLAVCCIPEPGPTGIRNWGRRQGRYKNGI